MNPAFFNIIKPPKPAKWQEQQDLFFMRQGKIWSSIYNLDKRLKAKNIKYCLVGGIALNLHGYERFTTDVDILMDGANLLKFTKELVGLGYRPAFEGATKTFYDSDKTRIEILVTGEYPGDGKPKPINFPDPSQVLTEIASLPVINLINLIELKLASGISNIGRLKDLADVQEMIKVLLLPLEVKDYLNAYVKDKYQELWESARFDNYQ